MILRDARRIRMVALKQAVKTYRNINAMYMAESIVATARKYENFILELNSASENDKYPGPPPPPDPAIDPGTRG